MRGDAHPVGGDDHDALAVARHGDRCALALGVVLVLLGVVLLTHGPILPHSAADPVDSGAQVAARATT